jgi:hypothetical protein
MRQAPATADLYLGEAIEAVEKRMGKGAAEKFPQIVAAFIQASAHDYLAGVIASRVAPALEDIAGLNIGDPMRGLGSSIEEAGQAIAAALSD